MKTKHDLKQHTLNMSSAKVPRPGPNSTNCIGRGQPAFNHE